jgi:hypothetical protein
MPISTTKDLVNVLFNSGKILCISPEHSWNTIATVRVEALEGGTWCITGERLLIKRIQRYLMAETLGIKQNRQLRRAPEMPRSFDYVRLHLTPGIVGGGDWPRTDSFLGPVPRCVVSTQSSIIWE